MPPFPVHTFESAPGRSKDALRGLQAAFGFVPNIAGAMATSPVLIGSLVALFPKGARRQLHGTADPDAAAD